MPLHGFNHIISWSDFIGRSSRPTGVDEDAQIRPEMSFSNFKLARKGKAVSITDVDIDISLIRSECWVIVRRQSEYLLKHEQGHYDILVLSAREFYNSLKGLSAGSTHELQKTVTKMQEDAQKKATAADARYDAQTKHGLDRPTQESWHKKISAEKQKANGSIDNLP